MEKVKGRYTTWTDDTLWSRTAIESGLTYGVYDLENEDKCSEEEQGGIITSYEQARLKANEMNLRLKNESRT